MNERFKSSSTAHDTGNLLPVSFCHEKNRPSSVFYRTAHCPSVLSYSDSFIGGSCNSLHGKELQGDTSPRLFRAGHYIYTGNLSYLAVLRFSVEKAMKTPFFGFFVRMPHLCNTAFGRVFPRKG
jgi:hypothetical protein